MKLLFILLSLIITLSSSNIALCQSGREKWQPPDKILDAIGVKPGMAIGEAGAGRGYFTFYLAERVGDKGKIYANDISSSSLATITARSERENVNNIEVVLGEIEDPLFPDKNLDMIIMVYVLHMLERPLPFVENLKKYMKSGAPLVILERNTHRRRSHPPSFMANEQILEMFQDSDYELESTLTFLPMDTIYIYKLNNNTIK